MSTDVLSEILGVMEGGGWGDLEKIGSSLDAVTRQAGAEAREEERRQAAIAAAALDTPAGRVLLDLLLRKTILRPPSDEENAARGSAQAYAILKAERTGQNKLMFTILSMLAAHRGQAETGLGPKGAEA